MSETSVLAGNAGGGDAEVLRATNLGALARDLLVGAFASLLVACAIECVAFNFDWLATLSVKEQPAQNLTWAYDPQAQWWIATVESTDVLKSLRVEPAEGSLEVDLYLSDEGHALPNRTGSLTPAAQDPKSQYLVTFSYGKLSSIALTCAQEQEPPICALTVNARVPLMVSYRRIALLAGLCVLAWLVRPSSQLRRIAYVGRVWSLACVWALCCVLIGLFVFENATCVRSYEPDGEGGYHTNRQYQELAVAFTRGEVCLPEQPSPELLAMDNPYDSKLR